jgi:hypothetical protein
VGLGETFATQNEPFGVLAKGSRCVTRAQGGGMWVGGAALLTVRRWVRPPARGRTRTPLWVRAFRVLIKVSSFHGPDAFIADFVDPFEDG